MCNSIHDNSVPIQLNSWGWKYFVVCPDGKLLSWYKEKEYNTKDGKTTIWNNKHWDDGFCIFLYRPKLGKVLYITGNSRKRKRKLIRVRVNYFDGLGEHIEKGFGKIALCKSFSIHDSFVRMGYFL